MTGMSDRDLNQGMWIVIIKSQGTVESRAFIKALMWMIAPDCMRSRHVWLSEDQDQRDRAPAAKLCLSCPCPMSAAQQHEHGGNPSESRPGGHDQTTGTTHQRRRDYAGW
jgi:hypothetical protein